MRLSLSLSQQTSPVFCLSFCRLLKLLQQTGVSSVPAGRDGFKVGNLSILQNTVQAGQSLHICLTSSLDQFRKLSALPAWLPWLAWLVWRPPLLDVEWSIIFGLSDTGQLLSLELNITEDCQSLSLTVTGHDLVALLPAGWEMFNSFQWELFIKDIRELEKRDFTF